MPDTIETNRLRSKAELIAKEFGGSIASPGSGADRSETWGAVNCILMLVITEQLDETNLLLKKILRELRKDD